MADIAAYAAPENSQKNTAPSRCAVLSLSDASTVGTTSVTAGDVLVVQKVGTGEGVYLPNWKIVNGALGGSVTLRPGIRRKDGTTIVYLKGATSASSAGVIEAAGADAATQLTEVQPGDEIIIEVAGANPAAQPLKAVFFYSDQ